MSETILHPDNVTGMECYAIETLWEGKGWAAAYKHCEICECGPNKNDTCRIAKGEVQVWEPSRKPNEVRRSTE